MSKANNSYPQPYERLVRIANDIFIPVSENKCVTGLFVTGSGKRVLLKFLLKEREILKNIFGKRFEKTLFVFVDPDEVMAESNEAYLDLILDNFKKAIVAANQKPTSNKFISNPVLIIKENLQNLLLKDWKIVFIMNDFEFTLNLDKSIFRNLESIHSIDKSRISYVFLSMTNLLNESVLEKFHNFKFAINRVVYYYPLFDGPTIEYVFDNFEEMFQIKISPAVRLAVKKYCGGHSQLLRYTLTSLKEAGQDALKEAKKAEAIILANPQLRSVCSDVWRFFNDEEKETLISVVKTEKIPRSLLSKANFLIKTGILKKKSENDYELFGRLMSIFVNSQIPQEHLVYEERENQIYYGSIRCSDKFTFQEFKLLVYFLQNEGKVVSRDEVGKVLWGRNYLESYSDWSIDKIISSMRKKMDEMNFPSSKLVTLKKRGFTFSN